MDNLNYDGPEFTDVMVDTETTHTLPDRGIILQIAAVKFNPHTMAVSSDVFDECLTPPKHRSWSQDTQQWWMQQKKETLQGILQRQRPYKDVLKEFQAWAMKDGHKLRFWSKPSHFDYMFISSYFHDEEMKMPFDYWAARDLRSYIEGLFGSEDKIPNSVYSLPFDGSVHNAKDDTFHQVAILFQAIYEKSLQK